MSQRDLSTMFFFFGGGEGRVVYNHVGDSIQPCGGRGRGEEGGSILPVGRVATEQRKPVDI